MMKCQADAHFHIKGITLVSESKKDQVREAVHDIKKIDVIYNSEFEKLKTIYNLPVFFKQASA